MEKVTIIMPVYNAEDTLGAALDSIWYQSYQNLEILIVDDGSDDKTTYQLKKAREGDPRIQVFTVEHRGAAAARNCALEAATGKYIYFADADDRMESDAIWTMYNYMEQTQADLLTFGYRQIDRKSGTQKEISALAGRFKGEDIRSDYTKWTSGSSCKILGSCWNKCFRRDIIEKYGIKFPEYQRNEEEIFILRYLEHTENICSISEVLHNFYPIDLQKAFLRLPDNYCDEVEEFRRERLSYAERWNCDNGSTREFIAGEYWGKMILGLRLCFNPNKKTGYTEFCRRCSILKQGLSDTGNLPEKVKGSMIYKCLKAGLTPAVWLLIKRTV